MPLDNPPHTRAVNGLTRHAVEPRPMALRINGRQLARVTVIAEWRDAHGRLHFLHYEIDGIRPPADFLPLPAHA